MALRKPLASIAMFVATILATDVARGTEQTVSSMVSGVVVQAPQVGLSCKSAAGNSAHALGDPLIARLGDPDLRGSNGNEVRQIYRIDGGLSESKPTSVLGWLYNAFDGRWQFQPMSASVRNVLVPVSLSSKDKITRNDVRRWIIRAGSKDVLVFKHIIITKCFTSDWTAKTR